MLRTLGLPADTSRRLSTPYDGSSAGEAAGTVPRQHNTPNMPELPEGTINAFIQNKNLAKYGLLKDNEGGFLAENFVDASA